MHIAWTGEFVFALLWSTLGLSVVTAALYFYLVRRGAAAKVTSLIYLSPPTTAVMGYLVFDERLGAVAIAGMAAAMLGVALANR
jgi:drug/metabolite transporter (DMT)-like permease